MLGPEVVAISATAVAIVLLFIKYRDAKGFPERLLPTWNEPRALSCLVARFQSYDGIG